MKRGKKQSLCVIFLFLVLAFSSSCNLPQNILQSTSEVDFSVPHKIQIKYNEHIYDTTVVLNNAKLEINFIDKKDLLDGAYVSLDDNNYKITYKDMAFEGAVSDLSQHFLPCVLYSLLTSFDQPVVLNNFDKERECYYVKSEINGYFVTLECYEKGETDFISIEIK